MTSEPCSPVFKEVQPRPSEQSISLISRIGIFMNFIIVHNVFLLLVIIVIKAIQPDCDKIKGSSVLLLETPLTRSKCISPYTHAQHLTRTSRTFYTFAVTQTIKIPLHPPNKTKLQNVSIFHIIISYPPIYPQNSNLHFTKTLHSYFRLLLSFG